MYKGIFSPAEPTSIRQSRTDAQAGGGTVQLGTPTLVGERGPELFVPGSAGSIRNNADTKIQWVVVVDKCIPKFKLCCWCN